MTTIETWGRTGREVRPYYLTLELDENGYVFRYCISGQKLMVSSRTRRGAVEAARYLGTWLCESEVENDFLRLERLHPRVVSRPY